MDNRLYQAEYGPANPNLEQSSTDPYLTTNQDPALKYPFPKYRADSVTEVAEKPRVLTDQEKFAVDIVSYLSKKDLLIEMIQKELRNIVNKPKEGQSILDQIMQVIFSKYSFFGWKSIFKYLAESDIEIKDGKITKDNLIKNLCNLGLSPNIQDGAGRTILSYIMENDSKEAKNCITFLLQKGAIVSPPNPSKNASEWSALKAAFDREDRLSMVLDLLMHNASMGMRLHGRDTFFLVKAIEDGYPPEVIDLLIEQGSSVNEAIKEKFGVIPITPLKAALAKADKGCKSENDIAKDKAYALEIVKVLIKHKLELNPEPRDGVWDMTKRISLVDEAYAMGHDDIGNLLMENGGKSAWRTYRANQAAWDAWFNQLWKERFENFERRMGIHTDNISNSTNSNREELTKACATLNAHFGKTITEKTDAKELKNLSRKCALMYHPDKNTDATASEQKEKEENFKEMMNALNILAKYRS